MDYHSIMAVALSLAQEAYDNLEVPIGCIIICPVNKLSTDINYQETLNNNTLAILGKGRNNTMSSCNATRHAEIEAIDNALLKNHTDRIPWEECILFVTVEPCVMCIAALSDLGIDNIQYHIFLGIKEIVFGCYNDRFGGCGSTMNLPDHYSRSDHPIKFTQGISAREAVILLRKFYIRENKTAPRPRKKENRILKEDIDGL